MWICEDAPDNGAGKIKKDTCGAQVDAIPNGCYENQDLVVFSSTENAQASEANPDALKNEDSKK